MLHDRLSLVYLAELMERRGINDLVICPGSRNAPIIEAFCKRLAIKCISIVDERSAAFFALGMAQQLNKAVAIACTSGSAALNFAPAIAEAYYQRVPMLVLTADRPVELIDQGDGQTIRQQMVFANYIRKSLQLPQSLKHQDDLWYANRLASEALNALQYPVPGPVHINLPFTEPLYGEFPQIQPLPKDFEILHPVKSFSPDQCKELAQQWNNSKSKIILAGQSSPDDKLRDLLVSLSEDPSVVVLTETTSNVFNEKFISCIDRCLGAVSDDSSGYLPDLLITMGGAVVSKRIKAFFRKGDISAHWHIGSDDAAMDTYKHLTRVIPVSAYEFFGQIKPLINPDFKSSFSMQWNLLSHNAREAHNRFVDKAPWSDLLIFKIIMEQVPAEFDIQLGNSTPVRYSQLFEPKHVWRFDSNRGTSGIDGGISTAAGACFASRKPVVMITGDLGFFYDSNALWNKHLPAKLRIIVINNQGGGIFRFIDGPDTTGFLEEFFETRHNTSAKHIAMAFGVDYFQAGSQEELQNILTDFFKPASRAAILEINSPPEISAQTLRNYFKALPSDNTPA